MALLAAMVAATVATTLGVRPAAAAGCYASTYNNQDPIAMSCTSDVQTIYTVTGVGTWGTGVLQLRWSPGCASAWGKVYSDGSQSFDSVRIENTVGNGPYFGDVPNSGSGVGSAYSNMINDDGLIQSRACLVNTLGLHNPQCTGWW